MERSTMHIFELSSVMWVPGLEHSLLKSKTTAYSFSSLKLYLLNFKVNPEEMLR